MTNDFPDPRLLKAEYLVQLQEHYEDCDTPERRCFINRYRNYHVLLDSLRNIHGSNPQHFKSYAKRLREQQRDFKSCEAIFSEIIVYRHYLRLVSEGVVASIDLQEDLHDIRLSLPGGSQVSYEVFCIMPEPQADDPKNPTIRTIKTHLQEPISCIRQKLLAKADRGQFNAPKFAVIELNSTKIAGDFAILSSLSDGYKISIDTSTMQKTSEGFDWRDSAFDDPRLNLLRGVIYFNLGDYANRKTIVNPNFSMSSISEAVKLCQRLRLPSSLCTSTSSGRITCAISTTSISLGNGRRRRTHSIPSFTTCAATGTVVFTSWSKDGRSCNCPILT